MYDIFISYSRKDTSVADRICKALDAAGISYFIDRQGIGGGMEFPAVLSKAIIDSSIILYIASKNSYSSAFTNSEITFAFNKKKSILPYIIDGSELPLEQQFVFSTVNWRTIENHPIETTLVNDLLSLLGRKKKSIYPSELSILKVKAAKGDSAAQADLAEAYFSGDTKLGVNKDLNQCFYWCRKSAENGNFRGQFRLGYLYHNGLSVEKDINQAIYWYEKAAGQNNRSAMVNLGNIYLNFNIDHKRAFYWYTQAAEKGNIESQYNLGMAYKKGLGTDQDYAKALYWLTEAAKKNYPPALNLLGGMYANGWGVTEDFAQAAYWYKRAINLGSKAAENNLKLLPPEYQ